MLLIFSMTVRYLSRSGLIEQPDGSQSIGGTQLFAGLRLKLASLPHGVTFVHIFCTAKPGMMTGSLVSGVSGYLMLSFCSRYNKQTYIS